MFVYFYSTFNWYFSCFIFSFYFIFFRKNENVLTRLAKIAKYCVKQTGLYMKMMKPVDQDFWKQEE